MKPLRQPENSVLCGQTVVAMIAECSVWQAVRAIGHAKPTVTADLICGLRKLGVSCAPRMRRVSRKMPSYPPRAILAIVRWATERDGRRRHRQAHWLVTWDGVIHDPDGRWPEGFHGWTITSYLAVHDQPKKRPA